MLQFFSLVAPCEEESLSLHAHSVLWWLSGTSEEGAGRYTRAIWHIDIGADGY